MDPDLLNKRTRISGANIKDATDFHLASVLSEEITQDFVVGTATLQVWPAIKTRTLYLVALQRTDKVL